MPVAARRAGAQEALELQGVEDRYRDDLQGDRRGDTLGWAN